MKKQDFDIIIIGSGISGLTAAAALAKHKHRVLLLEKHFQLGGLTQTFLRQGHTFTAGVHYMGGLDYKRWHTYYQAGRLLHWLSNGELKFDALPDTFDLIRFSDWECPVSTPLKRYKQTLQALSPKEHAAIDRYFAQSTSARRQLMALLAGKTTPGKLKSHMCTLSYGGYKKDFLHETTAEVLQQFDNPRLVAALSARWGCYGIPPHRSPFAVHALITGSHYHGAYYPSGGPAKFCKTLIPVITAAGGKVRPRAAVKEICVNANQVNGVTLADDEFIPATKVISCIGAYNTTQILSTNEATTHWSDAIAKDLQPSVSYVSLYLGFYGDIREHGATATNIWIYEHEKEIGRIWQDPAQEDAPSLFVSFSSLKNSAHDDPLRHTAEIVALCDFNAFRKWLPSHTGERPVGYKIEKHYITQRLLAQFKRHFPKLAPLIDFYEISTPLTQASLGNTHNGAMYGLEMNAERILHPALKIPTPISGLLLSGQDVVSPGIQGALMSGLLAAAHIEPRLWLKMVTTRI